VARGVRVYTIGFGTNSNTSVMDCGDQFQENDFFGSGGFGPGVGNNNTFRREVDETTLKQIADLTGGTYYSASSAGDLQNVFRDLPTYMIKTRQTTEISAFFTALAALVVILALLLSLKWHPLS
jgi:Ca-activated chloride channel family protein